MLDSFLHQFGESGDNGNGSKVGGVGGVAGFMNGMYYGVLPGSGKFTRCETGVDKVEKDMTNGAKTYLKNPDANTIGTAGRRVFHREENRLKVLKGDRLEGEGT